MFWSLKKNLLYGGALVRKCKVIYYANIIDNKLIDEKFLIIKFILSCGKSIEILYVK